MQDDDFQSLSKGVFVVPFTPPSPADPGPSTHRRPLKQLYSSAYGRAHAAYQAYEAERTAEQLDEVADWLERCGAAEFMKPLEGVNRLPLGIMQHASPQLSGLLGDLAGHVCCLTAKDAADLQVAMRSIAVGLVGEEVVGKKTGRSGMDTVERWFSRLKGKDRGTILVHLDEPESVNPAVLSEIIYILTLHLSLPLRLLLTPRSTSTLLANLTYLEPSSIDLSLLIPPQRRRKALDHIFEAVRDPRAGGVWVSHDLEAEVRAREAMVGGGGIAALKALKWALLRHELNSPLADLAEKVDEDTLRRLQALFELAKAGEEGSSATFPGRELLEVDAHPDLAATHDPAPRTAILHALSHPASFTSVSSSAQIQVDASAAEATPTRKRRRQEEVVAVSEAVPTNGHSVEEDPHGGAKRSGDLRELQVLYQLWKSAGRAVNLWDWLEGFRSSMGGEDGEAGAARDGEGGADEDEDPIDGLGEKQPSRGKDNGAGNGEHGKTEDEEGDEEEEEKQTRLHASFVRFCEEARMLGLVRARGRGVGRRGDEVVKGVGLV